MRLLQTYISTTDFGLHSWTYLVSCMFGKVEGVVASLPSKWAYPLHLYRCQKADEEGSHHNVVEAAAAVVGES